MSSHEPLLLRALSYPRAEWRAWLRYPRAVLWSFIGIRRGAGARSELNEGGLRPLPLIACALGLAALFVVLLLGLASQASAQPARPAPLPEAAMAQRLPVKRIGRIDEMAHAAVFLMESTFTTGTVLHVDGGHRLV